MMLSSQQAYAWLEETKKYGSVLGLDSMRYLLHLLGNPQDEVKTIHVAGTNGKGSVCCYLSYILQTQGYTVCTYTSPEVFDYRERWTYQAQPIDEDELVGLVSRTYDAVQEMVQKYQTHPTIFEIETAIAFLYFKSRQCDFAILEVGLGGREDATNVITQNICSVFASIGMDHMQFLGDSLDEIASAKAGIIKSNCPAVSIWQEKEAANSLEAEAHKKNTTVRFADKSKLFVRKTNPIVFDYKTFQEISLGMIGSFQIDNAVCALETLLQLRELGYQIDDVAVKRGMQQAKWMGRFEKIHPKREIYIDGAHNYPAAVRLYETLENDFTNRRITYIIGVLADKEYTKELELLLPKSSHVVVVSPNNVRALDGQVLYNTAKEYHPSVCLAQTMEDAASVALSYEDDMVLAFGSLSYLAEIRKALLERIEE